MFTMTQLVPQVDYEIFKKSLYLVDAITVAEEKHQDDHYEFTLLFESLNDLYYLGQFVGAEKWKELVDEFLKKVQSVPEDGVDVNLLFEKWDFRSVESYIDKCGGSVVFRSDDIENKHLNKSFVVANIKFRSYNDIFLLGKVVGIYNTSTDAYEIIYPKNES